MSPSLDALYKDAREPHTATTKMEQDSADLIILLNISHFHACSNVAIVK